MSEKEPLTDDQIQAWTYFIENETPLSPQESAVFVRTFQSNKNDICEQLDISKEQYVTVWNRINDKMEQAETAANIAKIISGCTGESPTLPFGSALIGCSNPHCEEDVQTATVNSNFRDFYVKVANRHDDDISIDNKQRAYFCSLDCIVDYEDHYEDCEQSEPVP